VYVTANHPPVGRSSDIKEPLPVIQEQSSASHYQSSPPSTTSLEQAPTSQQSPDITVCSGTLCMHVICNRCLFLLMLDPALTLMYRLP